MNLTSTTSWQIIPRPEDSVFRLGAAQMACIPNSESSISRSKGYFQNMQLFHMTTKRGLAYFIMPCQTLKPTWSSWASLLLHFNHIWGPSLYHIPFTPPQPRRGDLCHYWQAFTVEIFYSQSSHLNLVSSKIWSVNQNTLQATMLDTRSMVNTEYWQGILYSH